MGHASYGGAAAAGAAQVPVAPAPGGLPEDMIRHQLHTIITANCLGRLFPPGSPQLNAVVARLMRINWRALAAAWGVPLEMAADFAPLALYDIVIYADDSASMASQEGVSAHCHGAAVRLMPRPLTRSASPHFHGRWCCELDLRWPLHVIAPRRQLK